ncbi:response regulator [bacterium]|nr:response regulator [bacterium]
MTPQLARQSRSMLDPTIFEPAASVLVLDDQSMIRDLFHEVLAANHYNVSLAANLAEARAILSAQVFDAIVVDIFLNEPESGLALIEDAHVHQPNTPTIVISGMASMDHVIEALKSGAYDMLTKPLNVIDMLRVIARAVEKKRMSDENDRLLMALRRERDLLEDRVKEATHDLEETIGTLRALNEQMATIFELSHTPEGLISSEDAIRRIFQLLRRLIDFEESFCVVYDLNARDLHLKFSQGRTGAGLCEQIAHLFRREGELIHAVAREESGLNIDRFMAEVRGRLPEANLEKVMLMPLHVRQTFAGLVGLVRKSGPQRLSQGEERMIGLAISQLLAAIEQRNFVTRTGQLAGLGELISEIAHDLRHPMTALRGAAGLLATGWSDEGRRTRCLGQLTSNLGRMESLVSELVNFYDPKEMNMVPVDLNELLDKAIEVSGSVLDQHGINVVKNFEPGGVLILGLTRNLIEAFINLITNACHAMPSAGRLELTTCKDLAGVHIDRLRQSGRQPENFAMAAVCDNGCGIPEENMKKIFSRFFTTKPEGKGLGLSAVQRIVKKNLGHIHVESQPGKGSTFFIYLPKA